MRQAAGITRMVWEALTTPFTRGYWAAFFLMDEPNEDDMAEARGMGEEDE